MEQLLMVMLAAVTFAAFFFAKSRVVVIACGSGTVAFGAAMLAGGDMTSTTETLVVAGAIGMGVGFTCAAGMFLLDIHWTSTARVAEATTRLRLAEARAKAASVNRAAGVVLHLVGRRGRIQNTE